MSLIPIQRRLGKPSILPGQGLSTLLAAGALGLGAAAGALAALAVLPACVAEGGGAERIERGAGVMGTWVTVEVEADSRGAALKASEVILRALEATEARLSTWGGESELARLNAAPVGQPMALSEELSRELAAADRWSRVTAGAFDPAIGGLVRAWGLRTGGRRPTDAEIRDARVPDGLAALVLHARTAMRTDARLALEEGGFGKGAGLDEAMRAVAAQPVGRVFADLGGQVVVRGAQGHPYSWGIAHPDRRDEVVLRVPLEHGSLATTGNSERGIVVDGERLGHVLDPRSARPAADFGSLTVHAPDATAADCLSTGLYVQGPEAALAWARRVSDVDVLVLERQPDGRLRARATGALGAALVPLHPCVDLERLADEPDSQPVSSLDGTRTLLALSPRRR